MTVFATLVRTRETLPVATEIERKFVVVDVPAASVLGAGVHIRQGYLAEDGDVEVRVRIADGDATLAVKAGRGLVRTEVECVVTEAEAEALWPHTDGRRIDKVRYRVALAGADAVADVDVYRGALAGLVVAEVEFYSEDASAGFDPPEWFGPEVTGGRGWSNAALSRNGRPADPIASPR
jgi:adenylate cyclase